MEDIRIKNQIIYYYKTPVGYIDNTTACVDIDFKCQDIVDFCKNHNFECEFKNDIFKRLAEKEDVNPFTNKENILKKVRVWQLKPSSDFSMRFISFDDFIRNFGEPKIDDYKAVFDGEMPTNNLEIIYDICNVSIPSDYYGHPLSMSDIVELYDNEQSSFYYVDRVGFKEIDLFQPNEIDKKQSIDMKF